MRTSFTSASRRLSLLSALIALSSLVPASAQFTAYNDTAYRADQYTFTPYITTYTIGTSGFLKNQANSGAQLSVVATFTQSGGVTVQTDPAYGGSDCAAGTDAANVFGGIVDLTGTQVYGTAGWYVDLTLSGLNPGMQYDFVTTANRNGNYPLRLTKYTLSGADAFLNQSSVGVTFSGGNDPTATFCTGGNTVNGYVARWGGIRAGDDGIIQIRAEATPSSNSGYGFNAFRLAETVIPEPSSLAVLLLGALFWHRRAHPRS